MQIHGICAEFGFGYVLIASNAIIEKVSKCGKISEVTQMFYAMLSKNLISWMATMTSRGVKRVGQVGVR